ncbi:acyl-CoA--6-aminopenicillanic acid acyltransferase [Achromobacter sp. SD115]|uniref:C45 family autoproteolytic acyltransferase/hydolase n=1 Tax=Achromobacter sp. SD115 TaxID=2782011 RepID=UPI001A959B58|nr:C45 family peptidase [Achromobacter sp. SD115]MBO1011966.1 acyl-CoA--6-aminopenicillanic acid acyltransferase [Achromobacter sp. SD115]
MTAAAFFPLVEVSGAPYERGLRHGRQAGGRVRRSADIYARALQQFRYSPADLQRLIARFSRAVEDFEPDYLEEMRGIAEGAGVSFEDVLMINARTEIVAQARRAHLAAGAAPQSDECTGAAILPERSANGNFLQGQNWDNRQDCADTIIILRVLRDDGPDVLTFVEAGGLARYGMNSAGLTLNGNGMSSSRDYQQDGVPLPLVRRKALEQEHYALALQVVTGTPKACSCNLILGTQLGLALSLECAPDETFLVYPEDGLLVHANHWTSAVALGKLKETGIASSPESLYRDRRVRQSLSAAGRKLGVQDLKAAFADTHATPFSVCRPGRVSAQGYASCTTATLIMEPAAGVLEVARLPWQGAAYARYAVARGSSPSY